MTNLLTRAPKRAQPGVATMVRTIYLQISPEEAHAQLDGVVEQFREPFPEESAMLETPAPTSWPSPASRCRTGRSCGPTTRWSA